MSPVLGFASATLSVPIFHIIPSYRIASWHNCIACVLDSLEHPRDPCITVCKRVSALPGDIVDLSCSNATRDRVARGGAKGNPGGEERREVGPAVLRVGTGQSVGREETEVGCERHGSGRGRNLARADPCLILVPQGRVWLRGDNPKNSTDSRQYGAVPLSLVEGRVVAKLWPPSEVGKIRDLDDAGL